LIGQTSRTSSPATSVVRTEKTAVTSLLLRYPPRLWYYDKEDVIAAAAWKAELLK